MALPTALYYSPDSASFDTARACGLPVPIDGPDVTDKTLYAFAQRWTQKKSAYTGTNRNTAHPDASYSTFTLQLESGFTDIGGGVLEWTRTYAKAPAEWNEYNRDPYQFPGMSQDGSFEGDTRQRDPVVETVRHRINRKYFLIGAGQTYTTVPLLLASSTEMPLRKKFLGIASGGNSNYVNYLFAFSRPTKDQYIAMIDAETEILTEDAKLDRWMGNIHVVTKRYVVAQ